MSRLQEAIGSAQKMTAAVLRGGQPGPMLARLEATHTTMLAVAQHNNQARKHATTALAKARRIGEGVWTPNEGSPAPVQETHPQDGTDRRRGEVRQEPVSDLVHRLGRTLPARVTGEGPTEGFLVVGNDVVRDGLFSAEPNGRIRSRQIRAGSLPAAGVGLRGKAARATVMDHVEAQAASILRRPGAAREASLVLNNPPCDKEGRPLVCEKLLPHILPSAALRAGRDDGTDTRPYKTYVGTGEDIA